MKVPVHGIAAGGAGVGRLPDGRVVFAHRTAPGDLVRVELTREHDRWAKGRLDTLLEPGPGRTRPPCVHYARCGGCTLQHLDPDAQLQARGMIVRDALERIAGFRDLPEIELHPAVEPFGYRNRASFTLRRLGVRAGRSDRGGGRSGNSAPPRVIAGFHALERPDRIVDVGDDTGGRCLLLEPALAVLWEGVRLGWGRDASRLPAGAELRLTLRVLSDGSGILVVEGGHGPGRPEELLREVPGLRAIWTLPVGAQTGTRAGAVPRLLAGEAAPEEEWFGESIPIGPGAFVQVNRRGAERLHALALAEFDAGPGERVVDAYCGFGVYGRAAARAGARAVGIEADPGAVAMGRSRPVDGFELIEGRVEERLAEHLPADRVMLNPPRAGAHPEVIGVLSKHPPERVVYLSCDPATLARDLSRLGDSFRIRRIQAFDLFPQTAHVETLVTLDRTPAPESGTSSPSPSSP